MCPHVGRLWPERFTPQSRVDTIRRAIELDDNLSTAQGIFVAHDLEIDASDLHDMSLQLPGGVEVLHARVPRDDDVVGGLSILEEHELLAPY